MRKIAFMLLLSLSCLLYGQTANIITSTDEMFERMNKLPFAYKCIFTEVMNYVEIKEGKMTYTLPNGEVISSVLDDARSTDDFWKRIYEINKITEICSIPFGSTYERTKEILENKYGEYEYLYTQKDDIIYRHKKYAGVLFDSMHFLFQSDGTRSYFNAAIFCIDCKSKSEAIRMKNMLHEKLSKKYVGFINLDKDDEFLSMGGLAPIQADEVMGFGVHIDIRDYGKDGKILGSPYGVRLIYGPYDYVKEEF